MSQNKKSPRPELQNVTDMTVKQLASWGKKFGRTKNLAKTSQFWEICALTFCNSAQDPYIFQKLGEDAKISTKRRDPEIILRSPGWLHIRPNIDWATSAKFQKAL